MPDHFNLEPTLRFLEELDCHNDRGWFNQHRPDYEAARAMFEAMLDDLIVELRPTDDLQGLAAKNCIGRIYRDVRFSRDKTPYNTNLVAMIAPGGWGAGWLGYYISIQPRGQSMLAGGLYSPEPGQLDRFRQAIVRNAPQFKELISTREFIDAFGEVEGERLKTAPRGYDPAHPEIKWLQLKQITAIHHFSDADLLAGDFVEHAVDQCHALKPFLNYLAEILA